MDRKFCVGKYTYFGVEDDFHTELKNWVVIPTSLLNCKYNFSILTSVLYTSGSRNPGGEGERNMKYKPPSKQPSFYVCYFIKKCMVCHLGHFFHLPDLLLES